jgi:hypothetical protein
VLRESIETELGRLGPDFMRADGSESKAETVRARVVDAGDDTSTLTKYLNALRSSQPKEAQ